MTETRNGAPKRLYLKSTRVHVSETREERHEASAHTVRVSRVRTGAAAPRSSEEAHAARQAARDALRRARRRAEALRLDRAWPRRTI